MRHLAWLGAVLVLAVAADSAAARPAAISGSLSKRGYTVIALADSGKATRAVTIGGKFKLVPPARNVTLQLRDSKGHYAGPIVVGRKGRNAILGVRAGARLGRIKVKNGYAIVSAPKRAVVRTRVAAAKGGKPIGAGKLGLVKSLPSGRSGAGLDPDRDGIPSAIDIDDDGDLVLDHVDKSPGANGRITAAALAPGSAPVLWSLNVGLETAFVSGGNGYALNLNASENPYSANFTNYISQALDARGVLLFPNASGQPGLECQAVYCTAFGKASDITSMQRFPADFQVSGTQVARIPPVAAFNPDREGIGTTNALDPSQVYAIRPHTDVNGISSSDVYLIHNPADSQSSVLANASYIFATVPALAAWSDGSQSQSVSYPIATDGPGSGRSPIPIHPSADGHYHLTMSIWPPQSSPLQSYFTLGGLEYTVVGRTNEANKRVWRCPVTAYSDPAPGSHIGTTGVVDEKPDRAVDRADQITFTTDLTACLESSGLGTWTPNSSSIEVFVAALSATSDSSEGVGFAFRAAG